MRTDAGAMGGMPPVLARAAHANLRNIPASGDEPRLIPRPTRSEIATPASRSRGKAAFNVRASAHDSVSVVPQEADLSCAGIDPVRLVRADAGAVFRRGALWFDAALRSRETARKPAAAWLRRGALVLPACITLLLGATHRPARAADGLDLTLPPAGVVDQQVYPAITAPSADTGTATGILAAWQAWVAQARATQPEWSTPLVTTTGLLEQRLRFDVDLQHSGNGTSTADVDGGKGLDLIVNETTELQFAAPPYYIRSGVAGTGKTDKGAIAPLAGFNDWAFLRVTERLASSPASEGNYVVSALLQAQAPSGIARLTTGSWEYLPTLAAGKGWGAFDIQATVGGVLPASEANKIGYQVQTNVAFQYHVMEVLWPELEVSWTYYANGQRGGLNQVYLTPGLLVGRFTLPDGLKFTFGVGYQVAVAPDYIAKPLTPSYAHAWIFSTRLNF